MLPGNATLINLELQMETVIRETFRRSKNWKYIYNATLWLVSRVDWEFPAIAFSILIPRKYITQSKQPSTLTSSPLLPPSRCKLTWPTLCILGVYLVHEPVSVHGCTWERSKRERVREKERDRKRKRAAEKRTESDSHTRLRLTYLLRLFLTYIFLYPPRLVYLPSPLGS